MNPLETALTELHSALATFVGLLERETLALQDIDAETLSGIVAEKNQWSQTVNTAWNRLMAASGIDDSSNSGGKLEAALAGFPGLQAQWTRIRSLTETAERLNRSNSVLIEAQMRRTRQALDVLQNAANRGSLYGENGLIVETYRSRHTLDKA